MKPAGPGQRGSRGGAVKRPFSSSRLSSLPMEWMDPMSWRLPSGKALAEFALQAGFLAPLLFKAERFGRSEQFDRAASLEEVVMPSRAKHFGKGSSR